MLFTAAGKSVAENFLPMSSVPTLPEKVDGAPAMDTVALVPAPTSILDQQSLARAFLSFSQAASSLEHSYSQLQSEIRRLRRELAETHHDLDSSREEIHRVRRYSKQILEGLPCGVLVIAQDGTVALSNPETERLLGVNPRVEFPASIRGLFDQTSGDKEVDLQMASGSQHWVAIRRTAISLDQERAAIFILQDISERKLLEQEQEKFQRRQALADMSALLAHEIRNPLGSLELFAGLLAESRLNKDENQWVKHLQAGLRSLTATVNNVLHFHAPPKLSLSPVSVNELMRWLGEFLRPAADRARVRLELVPIQAEVFVAADRHRIEQVLLNLALNSFHFMPQGGVLKISSRFHKWPAPRRVRIEVADTGPGISPGDEERIFEAGFSTRSGSPGLGLAVCRTIMKQHGGGIRVDPCSEHGATFILELPPLEEMHAGDDKS